MAHTAETTPLLQDEIESSIESISSQEVPRNNWKTVTIIVAILTALEVAICISWAPEIAILEKIVCDRYQFSPLAVDEDHCKSEPVQSEVAFLMGWKDSLNILPGILITIPYGMLADRIGRKKVLLLSLLGVFLGDCWIRLIFWFPDIFPIHLIWLSGLWGFIGGGASTLTSMVFAMVAENTLPQSRINAFSQIQAAGLISDLVAVPISAPLIRINPWIPYLASSVITFISGLLCIAVIPETFVAKRGFMSMDGENYSEGLRPGSLLKVVKSKLSQQINKLKNSVGWMKQNVSVLLIICSFLPVCLARQVTGVLLQYATKRFHMSYDEASYFISLRSAASLVALSLMVPALSYLFTQKLSTPSNLKDKRIAQINGVLLVSGSTILFLATSWSTLVLGQIFFALGNTITVSMRSLATSLVDHEHLGILYTTVSSMTYTGAIIAAPIFAKTFSWGMQLEGFWMGLPFLVAGGAFAISLTAISAVKLDQLIEL